MRWNEGGAAQGGKRKDGGGKTAENEGVGRWHEEGVGRAHEKGKSAADKRMGSNQARQPTRPRTGKKTLAHGFRVIHNNPWPWRALADRSPTCTEWSCNVRLNAVDTEDTVLRRALLCSDACPSPAGAARLVQPAWRSLPGEGGQRG